METARVSDCIKTFSLIVSSFISSSSARSRFRSSALDSEVATGRRLFRRLIATTRIVRRQNPLHPISRSRRRNTRVLEQIELRQIARVRRIGHCVSGLRGVWDLLPSVHQVLNGGVVEW